jgi:hypothetical protein
MTHTAAGKAHAILGLCQTSPERALALIKSLPSDFRVEVMWHVLGFRIHRDSTHIEDRDGRFLEAIVGDTVPSQEEK